MQRLAALCVLLCAATSAPGAPGAEPSALQSVAARECREAADFIRNAAASRDAGMSRTAIVQRLHDDFEVVRAFPPALRWFVHNENDEAFLAHEVGVVFDAPSAGEQHRAVFLERCLARLPGGTG